VLVATERTMIIRCPACGKSEFHSSSRFRLAGDGSARFRCACGFVKAVLSSTRRGCTLQLACNACGLVHVVSFKKADFWRAELVGLYCRETGAQLGFLGADGVVREVVEQEPGDLAALLADCNLARHFDNPVVMYRILSRLHKAAQAGGFGCKCGNDRIRLDIEVDSITLRCPACRAQVTVNAEIEEDLENAERFLVASGWLRDSKPSVLRAPDTGVKEN